jgi:glycine cleavage system H lipoate-binding protein
MPHDLLTTYSLKAIEYPLAVLYLLLFIPFWRYVTGGRPAVELETTHATAMHFGLLAELFALPEKLFFHPGHAWARLDGAETVTVGIDEFGHRLVGPLSAIELPPVGAVLAQGEPAWSLVVGGRRIDMLAPVDGTVVAVNPDAASAFGEDAYDKGWLVKMRSTRLAGNVKNLLSGSLARRWMEDTCETLGRTSGTGQALGAVALDGGVPVGGMARALDPDAWDQLAKRIFLS